MKRLIFSIYSVIFLMGCGSNQTPGIRQGAFYTEEQGKAELLKIQSLYTNKAEWETRRKMLRNGILKGMNLSPLPERTPLNAVIGTKRIKDGYTVENVYFESIPGFYLCGNLYRPLDDHQKHPAILCPHGHTDRDSLGMSGRFRPDQQNRCASFARMGAVVFSYSMLGYGESIKQMDTTAVIEKPISQPSPFHHIAMGLTLQTWNSMRVVDFLVSIPDVDSSKIAVTGASGGGTQTFMLAALDDRISVSVPVVMVSCHFFGGCNCESGLPIHQTDKYTTNNAEIAAMIAPKPMLLISCGADWTKNTPTVELPFLKRTYSFYNAEENVENAHFPLEKHDYGFTKRLPVYKFMAKHLGLNINAITDANGQIDESKNEIEKVNALLLFSSKNPHPANALKGIDAIERALKKL